MSIRITVNIEEQESGNFDLQIKVNSLEEGATESEIEIAKAITATVKKFISGEAPTNKDRCYEH